MADLATADVNSREVRVFISSTFRDFNEERDLLVKQVFPSLRRRARKRGVEIVDVDLRWGITEEESEQGKVIGICLAEIERCRPYFIGMLGERYGWTPQPEDYPQELFEREQLQWIKDHQGGASVTELEILHGVLNNQEMAGRAFFYFRDPAWSRVQSDPGFVCDTPEEEQKLADLKQRIRGSRFQVAEDLTNPAAIAAAIEADLWALIDEQFPAGEQPDALEKEARKHADYRRARLGAGQYIGGEAYIEQLQRWLAQGQQQILITGESGAGKSALLANWMERHAREHPGDVVYAHYLGCTNDASALRPLLARLIDTASAQLLEAGVISEAYGVPEAWWDLVAKVAETLQTLGHWCQRQDRRWIWVLDGLDRLIPDDQKALPWLPLTVPEGVVIVASALACPAREILHERGYTTLTIQPLGREEQEQLIQRYLQRYTKELDSVLRQQILNHHLAGSPLFLKVLLEELRQCGRYDTLDAQLAFYLSSEMMDDLYERVLERLENDGSGDVRKVMSALWASRAGLTEPELLAVTDLKPLQWAPIDLALEKAFRRNGNRLVFDHDYLRRAVEDRYLPTQEKRQQAHSVLADWYVVQTKWDERKAEELPWQLRQAGRTHDLRDLLLRADDLYELAKKRGEREVINYWLLIKDHDHELDELIAGSVEEEIEKRVDNSTGLISFIDQIADLLDEAGLVRELLLRLRTLSMELEEASDGCEEKSLLSSLAWLAKAHRDMGMYDTSEKLYLRCMEAQEQLLHLDHPSTLTTVSNLAGVYLYKGEYEQAEAFYTRCLEAKERGLGPEHPDTLTTVQNLGLLHMKKGNYVQAEALYDRCLEGCDRLLGPEHPLTLTTLSNLGNLYRAKGDYKQADGFFSRCLEAEERLLGPEHPSSLTTVANLAGLFQDKGDYKQAEALYNRCLEGLNRLLGPEHPDTLSTVGNLAGLFKDKGDYEQAEALYKQDLEASERLLGAEHPSTLAAVGNLAGIFQVKGDYNQAEALYNRCLEGLNRLLGPEHPDTLSTVGNLAGLFKDKGEYEQAEALFIRCLEATERLLGPEHPSTLTTIGDLADLFHCKGDYEQAEVFYKRSLEARERLLGPEHPDTLTTACNLGVLYIKKADYEKAEAFFKRSLEVRERLLGPEHPDTLTTVGNLAGLYEAKGDVEQAEAFYTRCLEARERLLGPEHPDTNVTSFRLANVLSDQERYAESIPLRRQELDIAANRDGRNAPGTLTSIHRLAEDLYWADELEESEQLYREALAGRITALGDDDDATMASRYGLARCLSDQERYSEAIELRRVELAWCRQKAGDINTGTLTSIERLAIDLCETSELEEAEKLFRELVAGQQQVLEEGDFQIGLALRGLAITLDAAGKWEEASVYAEQALQHRLQHEGPNAWWTNRERLDLAGLLQKLGRPAEAIHHLEQLQSSLTSSDEGDADNQQLLKEAAELQQLMAGP